MRSIFSTTHIVSAHVVLGFKHGRCQGRARRLGNSSGLERAKYGGGGGRAGPAVGRAASGEEGTRLQKDEGPRVKEPSARRARPR